MEVNKIAFSADYDKGVILEMVFTLRLTDISCIIAASTKNMYWLNIK